jgi:hypothetical protein
MFCILEAAANKLGEEGEILGRKITNQEYTLQHKDLLLMFLLEMQKAPL